MADNDAEPEYQTPEQYKIVLLGVGGVGKSALTIQFAQHHFVDEYDPNVEDWYMKLDKVDDELFLLEVLDTGCQEDNLSRDEYMKTADGFVLVFAVDDQTSLNQLEFYREKINKIRGSYSFPTILVGNKCDLPSAFDEVQVNEIAKKYGVTYKKTSAKTREGVVEAFHALVRLIRDSKTHH